MNLIVSFARFWYDFVVGDDWLIAVVVAATLIVLKVAKLDAWWLLPTAVIVILGFSLWRVSQAR